jgi:diguanylate cyclase (GGDEF)-like protein
MSEKQAMPAPIAQSNAARPLETLLDGIDRGIEAHLAWNQRLMRCALLRESPGDDVLKPQAHTLCRFGVWFATHRQQLDSFDAALVQRIAQSHQSMHDAVRRMCERMLLAQPATPEDLQAYEQGQSAMVTQLNALRELVARASTRHDVLTGLPLRHGLEYAFDLRRKDALRAEAKLWLAMIDVDRFKMVNDTHGHAIGDQALQHVAQHLAACMRASDTLIRFGGEEFLALFVVRNPPGSEILAARLLDAVSSAPLVLASGTALRLTVTIGLARVRADEDLAAATVRADHALLQGKVHGRNRYVLAPD